MEQVVKACCGRINVRSHHASSDSCVRITRPGAYNLHSLLQHAVPQGLEGKQACFDEVCSLALRVEHILSWGAATGAVELGWVACLLRGQYSSVAAGEVHPVGR